MVGHNQLLEFIPLSDSTKLWNENQLDPDSHNGNTIYLSRHNAVSGYTDNVYPWDTAKSGEKIYPHIW